MTLRVADGEVAVRFYAGLLGYEVIDANGILSFSPPGQSLPHFLLEVDANASPRPSNAPGLYHAAVLLPSRTTLARILRHLLQVRWPLLGASNHKVSEALYLADPEGNGLEIYADRPQEEWPRVLPDQVEMVTTPLDLEGLLQALKDDPRPWQVMPPQARIGHVHLQVSSLEWAERFYVEILGFAVTQRSYPGALFVAVGGYHHHLGLNIWHSRNASPAPAGNRGLVRFAILIPDRTAWLAALERLERAGRPLESGLSGSLGEGVRTRDFDDIEVELWTPALSSVRGAESRDEARDPE